MTKPKALCLDVDGVLTDGKKTYDVTGKPISKVFNDKDFTAIKIFETLGVEVYFLTADPLNLAVAEQRNISCFITRDEKNRINKLSKLMSIQNVMGHTASEVWAIGDDYFDLELKHQCILFCPKSAVKFVQSNIYTVLDVNGGDGVVASLLEFYIQQFPDTKIDLGRLKDLDANEKWSLHTR